LADSPFVAEINLFPYTFCPRGWAWCDGQLLPISQNTALFSLLGTTYGGDGKSTFALPNLQGSAPLHPGQGPGLSERLLGEKSGSDHITLLQSEIPAHTHALRGNSAVGDSPLPGGNSPARPASTMVYQTNSSSQLVAMAPQALAPAGGGLPHNNLMPYLTFYFNIALQGIFPPRGS
jgi:microcystin-dependent protein